MDTDWNDISAKLLQPFPTYDVQFRPMSISKDETRVLAAAYIDARTVMDRLDDAVGIDGWSDMYRIVNTGRQDAVECTLTILGISKTDVGDSGQGGENEAKTCYSDALKRAAVKFGVGRYLYALPSVWCDYDKVGKRLKRNPALPDWAIPGGTGRSEGGNEPPPDPSLSTSGNQSTGTSSGRQEDQYPTGKPELMVMSINVKDRAKNSLKGKTLGEIERDNANTIDWVVNTIDNRPVLVKACKEIQAKRGAPSTAGPHWIASKTKTFWPWTQSLNGMKPEQVHEALNVESVKEFKGTQAQAASLIIAYAIANLGYTPTKEDLPSDPLDPRDPQDDGWYNGIAPLND